MAERYINNFKSSLYASINGGDNPVTIQLDMDSVDFPADLNGGDWRIKIGDEILLVTAVDLQTANPILTATRAQEGTTISAHGVGTQVIHVLSSASLAAIVDDSIHSHFPLIDGGHEIAAIDIEYDGTTSGLVANDIQSAIDEVESRVDDLETENPEASSEISYDNQISGLAATDVKAAIDELQAEKSDTGHGHVHNHDSLYDPIGEAEAWVEAHEAHDQIAFTGFFENITANKSAQMQRAGVRTAAAVVMTHPGYMTGLSAIITKTRSAGDITFTVYKNGVSTALTAVLDNNGHTWNNPVGAFKNPTYAFVAGDQLDVRFVANGFAWNGGGSCDSEATIEVVYEDES